MKNSPFWNSWSITQLTLFMVLMPLLCMAVILTYFQVDNRVQEMLESLAVEGGIITDHVSNDSEYYMFIGDDIKLQFLINEVIKNKNVEYAEIFDRDNNVIASAGVLRQDNASTDEIKVIRSIIYKDIFVDEENQEIDSLDVTVGWVHIKMSLQTISDKKKNIFINSFYILLAGLVLSFITALFISRSVWRPIKKLHSVIGSISAGKLDTDLNFSAGGEFAEIESGINKIANELQISNQQQEKRVDDATEALMEMVVQLEQKNVLLDEARKEAEEIGDSKVEFLANMSHEIRTPLNAVIGASDLLMKTAKSSDVSKYMSTLSIASRQLNSVVDDILDFSRMEANKLELENVALDILTVLENVISLYTPLANEKKLELILKVDAGMPSSIFGDPLRLSQVVSNLVSNAIKFTEKGQVVVKASAIIKNNINLRLQIDVIDTGAGLTESAQEKLFDAFSQADNAVARKYGGSGLGLAIVRKLIEQMKGFINVKSSVGKGTEFSIYLDLEIDQRKTDDYENSLNGISVLLYEKHRIIEDTVKSILVYWGVEVVTCRSDEDFIAHLKKFENQDGGCDCIVLGMGREVLSATTVEGCVEKVRSESQSPLILMLNTSEYELPTKTIDEKVCWLAKPVNRQLLYSKLSSINNNEACIAESNTGSCSVDTVVDTTSLFTSLNILIAEDNLFNRELLTDMLEAYGAKVVAVEDGQYAVDAALTGTFDIIFLDLHMPRKDGITAANEIKRAGLNKDPYLIAATADVFIKDQGDEVDVFDSFVFKPIREEVLLEKLTILLNFQGDYKKDKSSNEDDADFSEKLDREVRKLVLHIVEGSNNNNYPEIINFSHQLRGVCGFYEMKEMTAIAANLEQAAKDKQREEIITLIQKLLKILNISADYKTIH